MEPPTQPISDTMQDEYYTCESCFAAYCDGKNLSEQVATDTPAPFRVWYDLTNAQPGKRYACCDRGLVALMKCFPRERDWVKDLDQFIKIQHGSDYGKERFRDMLTCMYFSIKTGAFEAAKLKARVDELELKLDVLLDMKRMGQIDAQNGKRKRRDSF